MTKLNRLLNSTESLHWDQGDSEGELIRSLHFLGLDLPREQVFTLREEAGSTYRMVNTRLRELLQFSNRELKLAGAPGLCVLKRTSLGRGLSHRSPLAPVCGSWHRLAPLAGGERRLEAGLEDMVKLLEGEQVALESLSEGLAEELRVLGPGWVLLGHCSPLLSLNCPVWSRGSQVAARIGARDRSHYLWLAGAGTGVEVGAGI